MAKEDFCYTHYDGDEARDMTHMNRTERGAYTDIRIFQRKVGHLSIDQIKKVLSKDFEECWPAIELIMKQDDQGKYFIEWLDNSLNRAKKHSGKQSENGKNGGRPPKNKPKQKPDETQTKATQNPNDNKKKPLGDGDEYGNEEGIKNENCPQNFQGIVPEMLQVFVEQYPKYPVDRENDFPALCEIGNKIVDWLRLSGDLSDPENQPDIRRRWGELVVHTKAHSLYQSFSLSQINKHFQSICQSFNSGKNGTHQKPSSGGNSTKPGTSEARVQAAKDY